MAHDTVPLETTATVTINRLPDSRYRLKRALLVEIEEDPGGFVVSDRSTGVFHYERDFGAALDAFLRVFVSEFEFLRAHKDELSRAMCAELDRFQQILVAES